MKYYRFAQNSSGGTFRIAGDIGHVVVIEARTAQSANNRAEREGLFDLPYCDCCGPRFRPEDECDAEDTIQDATYTHVQDPVIWLWRSNGEKYRIDRRGNKVD